MALIDTALGQTDVVYVDTTETHTQADLISLGVLSADTTVYTGNGTMDLTSVLGVDALSNRYTVATGGADLTIDAGLLDLNVASARTLLIDGDSTITFSAGSVSALSALTNVLNNTTIAFSGSGDGTFTYDPPTINLVSAVTLTIDEMGAGDKVVIPMAGDNLYALRESGYDASTGYLTLVNGVGILSQSVTVRIKMTQAEYDTYAANKSLYLNGATDTFTFPGDDSSQPVYDVPCFSAGTLIRTAQGEVAIETLKVGDMVETRDNGLQPIRWVGSVHLGPQDLQRAPNLRPIRIRAGALGRGVPQTDLLVSPQHRVLLRSKIAERMFGTREVLVAAKQLLQVEGIDIATDVAEVTYLHMLFDRHEVVVSNGAETETLYTGPQALLGVGEEAREEIFALFPELRAHPGERPQGARPMPSGRMARRMVVRHVQNAKPLFA